MTKDVWIAKAAARYSERGGLTEAEARSAAEASYDAEVDHERSDPVKAADDDMDTWGDS